MTVIYNTLNNNQYTIKKMTKYKVKPVHKTTQFCEYLICCICIALCFYGVSSRLQGKTAGDPTYKVDSDWSSSVHSKC